MLGGLHVVAHRVALVLANELVDGSVEGGGEQQRLPGRTRHVDESPDRGQEAHVGHPVRLVDDHGLDVRQLDGSPLDQVGQPAGAGDEDVDTVSQFGTAAWRSRRHRRPRSRWRRWPQRGGSGRSGSGPPALASGPGPMPTGGADPADRRRDVASSRDKTANPNASVLPAPVGALPHTSRPASESGRVAAWIGKGAVMPLLLQGRGQRLRQAEIARMRGSARGRGGIGRCRHENSSRS